MVLDQATRAVLDAMSPPSSDDVVRAAQPDDCRGCGQPLLPGIVRYCRNDICWRLAEGDDEDEPVEDDECE
ncbi:MAG TPA: hypothetical protein VHB02_06250 [Acidimicrobiales bacterium]|nr:hypothetical protein [Acidimicrobiales bacterium]